MALRGITTDGSALYPEPIREIFGNVPHQVCEFHVLKELLKAVLHAVAKVRKELAAKKERMGRGRPKSRQARRAARRNRRLQEKIGDLFEHKNLFVARTLTPAQRRILNRITRGLPQLRTLRQIVEEVYRLFDRRCRMETALAKLAKLRVRVRRFRAVGKTLSKLFSPNLEKAPHLLGRQAAAGDFQRRGARQPASSEDAEDRLSCPHACPYQSSDSHRHASRSSGPRTIPYNPVTPLCSRRMKNTPFLCYSLE